MMKEPTLHLIYLGESGFPFGFAANQRQILISRGLIESGCQVTVLSFKGSLRADRQLDPQGIHQGIHYRYTSGNVYKFKSFFKRNMDKLKGRIEEFRFLLKLKKEKQLDVCLISCMHFAPLVLYSIWLKLLGVRSAINLVEYRSAIASRTSFASRLNDYFVDRFSPNLFDAAIPISDFLVDHVKKRSPGTPILKAPIICDFSEFDVPVDSREEVKLVYCGAPRYFELIEFVLEAFDQLELPHEHVFLDFILGGGTKQELEKVRSAVSLLKHPAQVRIHRSVPRAELIRHYRQATALLIPMRPTVQDTARFPHKLGEYLASGRAVITTRYGEIRHYDFIDGETALVAEGFEPDLFAEKMQYVLDYPEKACEIGRAGRQMGLQHFSHTKIGADIKSFLRSLNSVR